MGENGFARFAEDTSSNVQNWSVQRSKQPTFAVA